MWVFSPKIEQSMKEKFTARWHGPFVIIEAKPPLIYKVKREGFLESIPEWVHVQRIKPYKHFPTLDEPGSLPSLQLAKETSEAIHSQDSSSETELPLRRGRERLVQQIVHQHATQEMLKTNVDNLGDLSEPMDSAFYPGQTVSQPGGGMDKKEHEKKLLLEPTISQRLLPLNHVVHNALLPLPS